MTRLVFSCPWTSILSRGDLYACKIRILTTKEHYECKTSKILICLSYLPFIVFSVFLNTSSELDFVFIGVRKTSTMGGGNNAPALKGVAALNVYKKVAIIRRSTDALTYEDAEGAVKTITDLHLAASTATTPLAKPKPKDDIPVPKILEVESYDKDNPPTYAPPKSYVRYRRPTHDELQNDLEFVIDGEDEVWLINNVRFGGASAKVVKKNEGDDAKPTFQLPLGMLETMLDVMEKATAFEAIITMDQAEALILQKLPQLYNMYPIKARAGVTTLKHLFTDVYNYWVSKRSKLKRPLLRRFWPVTSTDDTNPHLVFRPREKEKYKLRKKRQNDMDAYRKMQQLKQDFQRVKALLDLVKKREELNRDLIRLQKEWFQQKLFDAVDTSGIPRLSPQLRRDEMDELLNVPLYFDTQNSWKKNKKARRGGGSSSQQGSKASSRSTSPVPDTTIAASKSGDGTPAAGTTAIPEAVPMIVAGQNHGEPAPLFVHPLPSRETYVTSWDTAVPHVTSYVDSHPLPTFRFRHRPRVGRGGRLCIDRVPQPIDPNITPVTVFTAGHGLKRSAAPKERLLDLLPRPLDHTALGRRIEAICVGAMKEEYDMPRQGAMPGMDAEENDGDEIIVKVDDWLNTDEQPWGEERFSLGPI